MLLERHGLEMRLEPIEVVLAELAEQKVLYGALPWIRRERKELSGIGAFGRDPIMAAL
jgi:hypothetical protein